MPKASNVLCHVTKSRFTNNHGGSYVWISDDFLAHTFNIFSRHHRRHGSNVPGPLEAQRRAARRRNTSIAYNSPYSLEPQPFELFGAKPKDGWWDRQLHDTKAMNASPSWLWSFLSPQKPPDYHKAQQFDDIKTVNESSKEERFNEVETKLFESLNTTCTHSDLMMLLQNQSIDLRQQPHLTQKIIQNILSHAWPVSEIEKFLLEPQMNPPGSANFAYLLENVRQNQPIFISLVQHGVYARAAALGLMNVEDLKTILTLVPNLKLDLSALDHTFAWSSFSMDLISALENSKVVHLEDLGHPFIFEWLELIKTGDFQPAKAQLLWTVYRFLGHSDRKALRKVVSNCIQTINNNCLSHVSALADFVVSKPSGQFRDILTLVTQDFVTEAAERYDPLRDDRGHNEEAAAYRRALVAAFGKSQAQNRHTSGELMSSNRNGRNLSQGVGRIAETDGEDMTQLISNRQPSNLEKWYAFLRILNTRHSTIFQLSPGFFKAYHSDTEIGLEEQQLFVIQLWVSMSLFDHCRWNLQKSTKRKVSSLFSRLFIYRDMSSSEDKLVTLIRVVRSLPLPAKHPLIHHASFLCKDIRYSGQTYAMLVKKMDDLERGHILNIPKTRYYNTARSSVLALLSEVAESMNEDMPRFEETCRSVIRETKKGPVLVSRLLTHNNALKFALQHAAVLSFSSPLRWENEQAAEKTALGSYSFNQVVNMVNNFAVECANNSYLTPRNRLRKVFWYYKFLHRCRAPIKPALLDALWIAAVGCDSGSSEIELLPWLYRTFSAYRGERTAKAYLQRAVLKDTNVARVATSTENVTIDEERLAEAEYRLPPSNSVSKTGVDEAQSGSSENHLMSSCVYSTSSDPIGSPTMPPTMPSYIDPETAISDPSEEALNTARDLLQIHGIRSNADVLSNPHIDTPIFPTSLTVEPRMKGTASTINRTISNRVITLPTLDSTYATSTTAQPQITPMPDTQEPGISVNGEYDNNANMRTLLQIPEDTSVTARVAHTMDAEQHKGEQSKHSHENVSIDNWLSAQYPTLESKMMSAKTEEMEKPAWVVKAARLTWI